MRQVILPIALVAALAACESDGRSGGGIFGGGSGSSASNVSASSPATTREQRQIARDCDPRTVGPEQRATLLHQDRPGGTSCPENELQDRRDGRSSR